MKLDELVKCDIRLKTALSQVAHIPHNLTLPFYVSMWPGSGISCPIGS